MSGQKSATTILMTLLLAAVIGVAAWLLYFSPTFEAIELTRGDVSSQQDFNFTLELQATQLAGEFERLPESIAEIVAVTQDIPPLEDTPDFALTMSDIVTDSGLLVQDLTIGDPAPVANVVILADAAAALEGGTYVSYVESLEFQGLVGTPFSVTFLGSWEGMLTILRELQFGEHRFFLVDTVVAQPLEPAEAAPPRPEIEPGWMEVTIGGYFFTQIFEGVNPNQKLGDRSLAVLVEEAVANGATVPADPNAPPPPPPPANEGEEGTESPDV